MALNEQDLRHVTEKLGAEWESLATYLGFSQSQIERFRIDGRDRGIGNVMFDMLVTWQHGKAPGHQLPEGVRRSTGEIWSSGSCRANCPT